MKTLQTHLKIHLLSLFRYQLMCCILFVGIQTQAQELSSTQLAKVEDAIAKNKAEIPLLETFLNTINFGNPVVELDDATTFKFKKVRTNISFSDVLQETSNLLNDATFSNALNNPALKELENLFKDNSFSAIFTIKDLNSQPTYHVSFLGEAADFTFELYIGNTGGNKDFVFAIAPSNLNFQDIHSGLKVLDSLANPNVGLFISKTNGGKAPEMTTINTLGLQETELKNGFSAVAGVQVEKKSRLNVFKIKHLIASAIIPLSISDPLVLTASIKPDWTYGKDPIPDVSVTDMTLTLTAGAGEGTPQVGLGVSFSLNTKLPSSPEGGSVYSNVSWTVGGEVSGSPDESGIGSMRISCTGSMNSPWNTPFGFNELSIHSAGIDLGLNIELKYVGVSLAVTVLPDIGIRGNMDIGKTQAINIDLAGKIDLSAPYESGFYGSFKNIGLGTIISELYIDKLAGSISKQELSAFDTIFLQNGKLSIFPTGGEIAKVDYPIGVCIAGKGKAFSLACDVSLDATLDGLAGSIEMNPIKIGETFSISGVNDNDPIKGSLNLQFGSIVSQLKDAFNGVPFLMVDAKVGLLGSTSQTKLLLNPIKGSYFASNTKILTSLDVLIDAETKSLLNLAATTVRGAFNSEGIEQFNDALIQKLDQTIKGYASENKIDELNAQIAANEIKLASMVSTVEAERAINIASYQSAKNDLQSIVDYIAILDSRVKAKWKQHDDEPFGWDWAANRIKYAIEARAIELEINFNWGKHFTATEFLNGLIWVTGIPGVDADPRVSNLIVHRNNLVSERNWLLTFESFGTKFSESFKNLQSFIGSNGLDKLVDVKKIHFDGKLDVLSGGSYDAKIQMTFLNNEISIASKINIDRNGVYDLTSLANDLLKIDLTDAISFESNIGKKYNYLNLNNTINDVVAPDNSVYTPVDNSQIENVVGDAGDVSQLGSQAKSFNGTNDFVEHLGSTDLWDELTIEAWIKTDGSNGDFQTILAGNDGFAHFQMNAGSAGNNVIYLTNGLVILLPMLPDVSTQWRHVAIVAKVGESALYQNGELIGSVNIMGFGDGKIDPTKGFRIGGNKIHGRYLKGNMANVRVWNMARSQSDIKSGMHNAPSKSTSGLVCSYFDADIESHAVVYSAQSEVIIPGIITQGLNELTVEAWVHNTSVENDIQAIVSAAGPEFVHIQMSGAENVNNVVYVDANSHMLLPRIPKLSAGWHHIALSIKSGKTKVLIDGDQIGSTNTQTFSSIKNTDSFYIGRGWAGGRPFNGKIANVRIWNKAKTTAEINSNSTNFALNDSPGLLYHSPTTNIFNIASASDCVPVPSSSTTGTQSLTIEAWVNNSSVQNDIQAIISSAGPEFVHLQMSADENVSNAVYLNDGRSIMLPVIPKLSPGWHHVALVVESGKTCVYIDGLPIGSPDTTTFTGLKDSHTVHVGKGWQGGRVFNGKVADVRIWKNRTLTQQQLIDYANTPPPASAFALAYHLK